MILDLLLAAGWWQVYTLPVCRPWACGVMVLGLITPVGLALHQPVLLTEAGSISRTIQPIGMDAETLGDLPALASGQWIIVLFSDTCPQCQRDLPRWVEAARRRPQGIGGHAWAFVGVGSPGSPPLLDEAQLSEHIPTWRIVSTTLAPMPCALRLDQGRLIERLDRVP